MYSTNCTRSHRYLHLNLGSGVLGGLELLHQHVVTQEVALCSRQPGQQLVLQKLQLDLEHVLLLGQFTLWGVAKIAWIILGTANCTLCW